MVKLLSSLFCSALLFSSQIAGLSDKGTFKGGVRDVKKDNIALSGFPVVIVYVKPTDCPVVSEISKKIPSTTTTGVIYKTGTVTTDIYVTKMPESCPDKHCEPTVKKECVTKTYTYVEGNSGDANYGGNLNQNPSEPGPVAMSIIDNAGDVHTTTIITDGPTTSIEYKKTPEKLETKQDPLLVLPDVSGPNTLSIDTNWSPSSSSDFSEILDTNKPKETSPTLSTPSNTKYMNTTSPASSSLSPSVSLSNSLTSSLSKSLTSSLSTSEQPTLQTTILTHEESCFGKIDLFQKIPSVNPGDFFASKQHPFQILPGVSNAKPFQTNKFYSNLFLGKQDQTVFTYPYEIYWEHTNYNGLAVQYPNPQRKVFDGVGENGAKQFYINGLFAPVVFAGATAIGKGSNFMSVSDMSELSVNVKLSATSGNTNDYIEFPLVEGMGLVSSIYHGALVPKIQGFGGISEFFDETQDSPSSNLNQLTKKYRVKGGNGETWLILVTIPSKQSDFKLEQKDNYLVGSEAIDGLIVQYALASDQQGPTEAGKALDKIYNGIAGKYVVDAKVSGSIDCAQVQYRIQYQTKGQSTSGRTLVFAFPHHIDILDGNTASAYSGIEIPSTTKGIMKGYLTDALVFNDVIDKDFNWLPYVKGKSLDLTYTKQQIELIRATAVEELKKVDIIKVLSELGSQYYMGKALDKYAYIMYVLNDIVKDDQLAAQLLDTLKKFFQDYRAGKVKPSLYYDTKLKGVVSDVSDALADFGSGYYNDHNFHYSYAIHAAALIGYLDSKNGGTWVTENKDFVNTLVRDVANPSENDQYFPVFRSFDWFQGHSWAKGVFESGDGKDLESTSEDVHFSYAMKMWGKVTGDKSMEARGSLMLKIQERSFNSYFLYKDDNTIVPKQILNNKVSGIFFENKVDYSVYFSKEVSPGVYKALPEFKHGIQMIPMTPALGSVRSSVFAQQEWNEILHDIDADGGWEGILNANRVLFDPSASWDFFAKTDFDYSRLDGGQSRTWALTFAAPFKNKVDGLQ